MYLHAPSSTQQGALPLQHPAEISCGVEVVATSLETSPCTIDWRLAKAAGALNTLQAPCSRLLKLLFQADNASAGT